MENTLNGVQAAVVEPETTSDANVTSEVSTTVEAAVAKPQQSEQDNAKFAEWRRKTEQLERELEAERAEKSAYSKLQEVVSDKLGYKGKNAEEIRLAILAEQQGKTVDEIKQQELLNAQREDEQLENNPKYKQLKTKAEEAERLINEQKYKADLAEIKAKYPGETATDIKELGEMYMKFRAMGADNLSAYMAVQGEAIHSKVAAEPKPTPPDIGAVNNAGATTEKEYYSPTEVDRLTKKDLDNPTIFAKVMQSMTRWKTTK